MSGFIDGGMRAGIPSGKHDMVATSYGDVHRIQTALDIHDLDSTYVYLVDGKGLIHFRAEGWAAPDRLDALVRTAKKLHNEP
jgi:hypothetical protein